MLNNEFWEKIQKQMQENYLKVSDDAISIVRQLYSKECIGELIKGRQFQFEKSKFDKLGERCTELFGRTTGEKVYGNLRRRIESTMLHLELTSITNKKGEKFVGRCIGTDSFFAKWSKNPEIIPSEQAIENFKKEELKSLDALIEEAKKANKGESKFELLLSEIEKMAISQFQSWQISSIEKKINDSSVIASLSIGEEMEIENKDLSEQSTFINKVFGENKGTRIYSTILELSEKYICTKYSVNIKIEGDKMKVALENSASKKMLMLENSMPFDIDFSQ